MRYIVRRQDIRALEQMQEKLREAVFGGYTIEVTSREQWDYMVKRPDRLCAPKDDEERRRMVKAQLRQALEFKPADHFDREAEKAQAVEREERWQKEKARLHEQYMRELAERELKDNEINSK